MSLGIKGFICSSSVGCSECTFFVTHRDSRQFSLSRACGLKKVYLEHYDFDYDYNSLWFHAFISICRFEKVFDQQAKQDDVFEHVAKPVANKYVY